MNVRRVAKDLENITKDVNRHLPGRTDLARFWLKDARRYQSRTVGLEHLCIGALMHQAMSDSDLDLPSLDYQTTRA